MRLIDYHTHSRYSFDGSCKIEDMAKAAFDAGVSELAITDHVDIVSANNEDFVSRLKIAKADVLEVKEKYDGKINILFGIELGQPQACPSVYDEIMRGVNFDFIIGSIHNLDDDEDIYYSDFKNIDCDALYDKYLDAVITLAEGYDYDVLGHLTYPERYMYSFAQKRLEPMKFAEKFRRIFKTVVDRGKGIEVNTSGYRQGLGYPFPSREILKMYKDCGGEYVTTGSDAHRLRDIAANVKDGTELIKSLGFKYITSYKDRRPSQIKI